MTGILQLPAGHVMDHGGQETQWQVFELFVGVLILLAALGYPIGLWISRHRGHWPVHRTVLWFLGVSCLGAGLVGPVAQAARQSFTGHMVSHLLLGMIAPLLLVLAAPITVLLRALPVALARQLSWFLRTAVLRFFMHPSVALMLNAGGLWLLYTTGLYPAMHTSVWIHVLVHAHVFLAGYLFIASLVGIDPNPHRASMLVRSLVIVLFIAAHSVLGKWLYAHPPLGVEAADAHAGAQLMYYGGDVVDVALIVLLFSGWYTARRPRAPQLEEPAR